MLNTIKYFFESLYLNAFQVCSPLLAGLFSCLQKSMISHLRGPGRGSFLEIDFLIVSDRDLSF